MLKHRFSFGSIFPNGRPIERFFGPFGPEIRSLLAHFWGCGLGSEISLFLGVFGRRRTVSLSSGPKSSLLKNRRGPNRSLWCTLFFQFAGVISAGSGKKVCTVATYLGSWSFFRMNRRSVGVSLFEKKCAP